MSKWYKSVRLWILIVVVAAALIAISPNPWNEGVVITGVEKESPAALAGMTGPAPTDKPMDREKIIALNGEPLDTLQDYRTITDQLEPNQTVTIETNEQIYTAVTSTTNDLGLFVAEAPKSNLKKGLDLQGGTRVLLRPEQAVSDEDMALLLENMQRRLNVYGLSDVVVKEATDFAGNSFVVVEVAGTNEEEVKELLAQQGKFEAKINNQTVFRGGDDVVYVCRTADCAFPVDPNRGCSRQGDQYACTFSFAITLSPEAAQRQADATRNLTTEGQYLSQPLDLYLDNEQVDSLQIGADLKGRPVTDISISGPGYGATRSDAADASAENMKQLQTVLITGSLPVELSIEKVDTISPQIGAAMLQNTMFVGLLAILAIGIVVGVRFRKLRISVPIMITMLSEIVLILGFAAMVGWNLDLAAIAGILVAAGTGVDDQIVITDEALDKKKRSRTWKERLKSAFFIIMGAYFCTVVAMIPLLFVGAGLVKGFALTTIVGVSVGVFLTRPVYAHIIEQLLDEY